MYNLTNKKKVWSGVRVELTYISITVIRSV